MKKLNKINTTYDLKNLTFGERLRFLRALAGLTRKKLQEKYRIPSASIDSWERNISNPTPISLKKIIATYHNEGITVSENWLLTGLGSPPSTNMMSIASSESTSEIENINASVDLTDPAINKDLFISKESYFFKKLYKNSITMQVSSEEMRPFYEPGDTIGGILRSGAEIESCLGKDCIILPEEGGRLFRRVIKNMESERYNLICINPILAKTFEPVIYNVKIAAAAPVIWVRRYE